jgi:LuxR family transcriptional regulator, maltose regulon positive regulatory protein
VRRGRLLAELDRASRLSVVLVAAPAGYGKTTLVAQWLADSRAPRTAAWLTLDAVHNDPGLLWLHVATALEAAGCQLGDDAATLVAAHSSDVINGVLPRMLTAMAAMPDEVVLVLDDFHVVQDPACLEQVDFLVEHLPPRVHLFITTRAAPGLRLGRLRVRGQLAEIRAADLAFSADEVSSLLAIQQVELSDGALAQLMDGVEGWPAGLCLAILSLVGRTDPDAFVRQLGGNNRFIGDYLTEEVLSRQPDPIREFIIAMSIVDRFSPELGDFLVESTGSALILHELERANMFLVALDEERRWFRFHHVLAAVARTELENEQPDRIPLLHARAASWFLDHGHIEEAVTHLLASGDTGGAAAVVQANWMKYLDAGRATTVLAWFDVVGTPSIADPVAGVAAAWMAGMAGDEATLAAHVETLKQFGDFGPLPDGTRCVESAIGMIQGLFGYGGPVEMLAGARRAVELETDDRSPHFAIAGLTLGHAAYVAGDLELATQALTIASRSTAAPATTRILALSNQSLVESELEKPDRARALAERAMKIAVDQGLDDMPVASMAYTALGQVHAAAGHLAEAMSTVEQGMALCRQDPGPWMTLHHLLVAARVAVDAGELSMARELIGEASKRMDRFSDGMGPTRARLAAVRERLRSRPATAARAEPLTNREYDVLRLLQRSLSVTDMAGELHLSPNTVKTHTQALYRKLGARSRDEAIRIARERLLI